MNEEVKEEIYSGASKASLITGIATIILLIPIILLIRELLSPDTWGEAIIGLGFGMICLGAISLPLSITAIVSGSVDLSRISQGLHSDKGKGQDIFGIVSGGIFILILIPLIVFSFNYTPTSQEAKKVGVPPIVEEEVELLEACKAGNLEEVERLLEQGTDVNTKDNYGRTALMSAAILGHTEIAELLIDNGADVDAKNNINKTALMYAEENGHTEIVDLLKAAGATE